MDIISATLRRTAVYLLAAIMAGIIFIAAPAPQALGATYGVDTTVDDPGVALTACTGAAGDCSLRGAVSNADTSGPGDLINFDSSIAGMTITLDSAVSLNGGGDTLDGTGSNVVIKGNGEPAGFSCLTIISADNTLLGLQITDCQVAIHLLGSQADNNVFGPGNVIYDNNNGIFAQFGGSDGNVVKGNKIGTTADGSAIHPDGGNQFTAISMNGVGNTVGGTAVADRNIVGGNGVGIQIGGSASTGNLVVGNYVGVAANGTSQLANGNGVTILNSATNNTVGGPSAPYANLISGNTNTNLSISGSASLNTVTGNLIGPSAGGGGAIPINGTGVFIGGAANNNTIGPDNIISDATNPFGGMLPGVHIFGSGTNGNIVKGNFIGTGPGGSGSLPNGDGVLIESGAQNNIIGGPNAGDGNVIAFNLGDGVDVRGDSTINNTIAGNSIHSNTGLGIDLGDNGVTPNDLNPNVTLPHDGDEGPNRLQNFPLITSAIFTAANKQLTGRLNSAASTTYTLRLYSNGTGNPCDASGNGEGLVEIATAIVTTNGAGDGTFAAATTASLSANTQLTATATDTAGNTSEFSPCYLMDGDADDDGDVDTADNCPLWPNPSQGLPNWTIPAGDHDCDRFTSTIEAYLGTDPAKQCPDTSTASDERIDSWPTDLNDNRVSNTIDTGQFVFSLNSRANQDPPDTRWNQRHDFTGNGIINTIDVGAYVFVLNQLCVPNGL